MSKKCVVGGVLSMDSGRRFGFKDAMYYKRHLIEVLQKENIVVCSERGYHE